MTQNTIVMLVELIVMVLAFVVGRYVIPNIPSDTLTKISSTFTIVLEYATSFCAYAQQFMQTSTGSEKMEWVVERLTELCTKNEISIDEDEIRAVAQRAYNLMKNETLEPLTAEGILDAATDLIKEGTGTTTEEDTVEETEDSETDK